MRQAIARLSVVPFEAAIAALLVISGVAALLNYGLIDPVQALLPGWEALTLSSMSVATGVLMLAGTAAPHRGAEAAGMLFLIGVISVRFLLFGVYLGFGANFAVTGVFDTAVVVAALVRLDTIRRGQVTVRVGEMR